jgi:hypothetical protein
MADVVFVAIALAFFAICALYVRWCDIIIGPDEVSSTRSAEEPNELATVDEVAA